MPTYGRDGCYDLPKLEFVEDCGLASSVQPNHQDSHLFLAKEPFEEGGKEVAHRACCLSVPFKNCQPCSECVNSAIRLSFSHICNIVYQLIFHTCDCW